MVARWVGDWCALELARRCYSISKPVYSWAAQGTFIPAEPQAIALMKV